MTKCMILKKIELLQHIKKWKEKANFKHNLTGFFFWQKKNHHSSLTLYAI